MWGWAKKNPNKCSDVMNSFNTYMNNMVFSMIDNGKYDSDNSMKKAIVTFKKIMGTIKLQPSTKLTVYFMRNNDIKTNVENKFKEMIELSKWTNTIGNFVLRQETKRGKRGENVYKNSTAKDRIDVYLYNLKKYNEANNISKEV